VVGLGEIGDEKATEHLIKILDDETWGIRDNAVVALMKIGGEKVLNVVIQTLIETLDEPFDFRCKQAIIKLGEIGDERAAEPLIKILNENTKVELRIEAAKALGRIGSEKAIGALVQVYKKDRDKQLQSVAKEILDRLGKRPKSRFEKMFGR
jgi:HEAT repeat protein